MKGHHSAGLDHHSFACTGIPALARALTSDCKLAKAIDGDRLALLKRGLEESKEPFQYRGRFFLRNPCLLMNVPGNIRLLHRRHFLGCWPIASPLLNATTLKAGIDQSGMQGTHADATVHPPHRHTSPQKRES